MKHPIIQSEVDLKSLNSFGIQAKAQFFAPVKTVADLTTLLENSQQSPIFVLGGGSNILFTQNYAGLMIKNEINGIECVEENEDSVLLKIGAGENWHKLVLFCVEKGYGGIENLSLIPGTVGAAPIQNIGAYGVELKDVFHSLEAVQLTTGTVKTFDHAACKFGYRDSIFKSTYKNQYIITHVTLRLQKKPVFNIQYAALKESLAHQKNAPLTLKEISDAVVAIRRSKLPDPAALGNAGSFFKNPVVSMQQLHELQNQFSTIPYYVEQSPEQAKIPAGWLIEQCGWKGKKLGNVGIYEKQALVIVNYGLGTGQEIWQLAQQVRTSVAERFGITLVPEVNIL